MILQGNNLIIKLNGVAIAAAKSCSISVEVKLNDVSDPSDGKWKHSKPGRKFWKISTGQLLKAATAAATPIRDSISKIGQTFTISFDCRDLSSDTMSGSAICKSFKTTGSVNNLMVGTFEWEGTGPLTPSSPVSSSEL